MSLNFHDIQGNILRAYNFGAGVHFFIHVRDEETGRALLRDLLPEVTRATAWTTRPVIALNIAMTFSGLKALSVDESILDTLPLAFREPIRKRARRQLGDNPNEWDRRFGTPDTHLLVLLASSEKPNTAAASLPGRFPQLACARRWLLRRMRAHGARLVYRQWVATLSGDQREHFGFADGFGQPAVEHMSKNWPGQGTPEPETGAWRDIKAGEFILGYRDEDGASISDRDSASRPATWLLYDGSYMVYRKLRQNVPMFLDLVAAQGRDYARAQRAAGVPTARTPRAEFELMAAKLVGRWRDGKAIELRPGPNRNADLREVSHEFIDNDFRYGGDAEGFTCPVGAHIRRTNPRDLLGRDGTESRRHRIIRRGAPYGPPYQGWDSGVEDGMEGAHAEDDGRDRGLIFICFNADLEQQFEVVQGQWTNDGNEFGLGDDQDYLLGSRLKGNMTIEGDPPFLLCRNDRVVVTRGCEYLFMPGLAALERLAAAPSRALQLEEIPPKEPAATHRVVEIVLRQMTRTYRLSRPMRRGQHPKTHALLKAEFIVEDVPADLRFGVFAVDKTYDAWIRFSSSNPKLQSDSVADAQGMAIKLVGVDGPKLLPNQRCAATQDFILVDFPNFFLKNAMETADFAECITANGVLRDVRWRALMFFVDRMNPRAAWTLRQTVGTRIANPLNAQYWSQTPYALGEHAVKYLARPERLAPGQPIPPDDWDGLEDAIKRTLKRRNAEFWFEFLVQRQADPISMPVEDPTVRWSERDAPFRKVARIRITHQDFTSRSRRNRAEKMSFTPWHSLPEHRPLGGINRVRRAMYQASSGLRHDVNHAPEHEPGPPIVECPQRMMDWVQACAGPCEAPPPRADTQMPAEA
jgi:Dyp-type peroxidase family